MDEWVVEWVCESADGDEFMREKRFDDEEEAREFYDRLAEYEEVFIRHNGKLVC